MKKKLNTGKLELFYWILTVVSIIVLISISSNAFSQEKPGPTNTGPTGTLTPFQNPQGFSTFIDGNGSLVTIINVDGTTIENKTISGSLHIKANNVTIRNCRIDAAGNGYRAIYCVRCDFEGFTGTLVENCELFNTTSAGIYGQNYTLRRCNIYHSNNDAIKIMKSNVLIEYNWLHHLGYHLDPNADPHADGIQMYNTQGSNIVIRYNNFDMPYVGEPEESIYNHDQAIIVTVATVTGIMEYNWINAGGSMIHITGNEIAVRYNQFGRDTNAEIFYRGNVTGDCPIHYCNVFEDTGEPLDECDETPLVAAPIINPNGGVFPDQANVSITSSTLGAEIRYTLDGSAPTQSSILYAGTFNLSSSAVVKARGYKTDMLPSTTTSASFVIAGGDNISQGKSVTVSDDDGNVGANIVDGDTDNDSRWSASGYPQWAEIDLGSNHDLSAILVYTYQDRAYQYIVEAKPDGGSYTTIVDRSTNSDGSQPIADNVSATARYVKITVSGASGYTGTWVSINEVQILGTGSGASVPVTGVSVSPTSLNLEAGQSADLTESVTPSNATNKSVTWSSNNTSVATVNSSGLVTAIAAGNATITATTNDGGYTANCTVTATQDQPPVDGYYCDPVNGSMSNNGSESSPWASLQQVFAAGKTFTTGDVIYLKNGNHGIPVITGNNSGDVSIMPAPGANPQIEEAIVQNASHWVISGLTVSPEIAGRYKPSGTSCFFTIASTASYITVENCYMYSTASSNIAGLTETQMYERMGNPISVGGTNCTIRNNTFKEGRFMLMIQTTGTEALISNNLFEGIMEDGIRALADNCIIEHNTIRQFYGVDDKHDDGIQSWSGGSSPGTGTISNVTIRNNIIMSEFDVNQPFHTTYGMDGIGCFDGYFNNWLVENNLIVTDMWHGITFMGANNTKVINNTVVENPFNLKSASPWITITKHKNGSSGTGNVIRNNISSLAPGTGYAPIGTTVDHNIITIDYSTYFENYSAFNLHLKTGSPAIDAGSSVDAPTIDIEGNSRVGAYDIGCYEYSGVSDTQVPSVPTGLSSETVTSSSVALSWNASTDNVGVTGYKVYTNGSNPVTSSGTSTIVSNLSESTTYSFTVSAYDAAGNESAQSSPVNVTTLTQTGVTSNSTFQSFTLSTETGTFTAEYDAIPNGDNIDAVTGIQNGVASAYSNMACIARFNSSGQIDARNGGGYAATNTINYASGISYHFRLEINIPTHTYSVYVTPQGGSEQTVASDFAFRSEQAEVAQLTGWSLYAYIGSHTIENMTFSSSVIIPVTNVSVSPTTLDLTEGQTSDLTETVAPVDATDKSVSWSSSNSSVATVDANGLVTAVAAGNAIITVTTTDGGFTANCSVSVTPAIINVTSVSVSPTTLDLTEGQTSNLTETVAPADATNKSVSWSSSNSSVATVDANGLVTAVTAGNATITVTTTDGGFTANCSVSVTPAIINVTSVSVSPTTLDLTEGQTSDLTETVAPVDATDKSVSWLSNNSSVATVDANGLVTAVAAGNATITVTTTDGGYTANCAVTVSAPAETWTQLTYDDFESGWGNFQDGGGDCNFYTGGTYAHQGSNAAQIQDNTGYYSTFFYSNAIDVQVYSQIKVEFWFYGLGMDDGHSFFVEYSDNGGSTWQIVAEFVQGPSGDFVNDQFYSVADDGDFAAVIIDDASYNFSSNAKILFRCNGYQNDDQVYIDEVKVTGLASGTSGANITLADQSIANINIYPNPLSGDVLNIQLTGYEVNEVNVKITDLTGRKVYNQLNVGQTELQIPVNNLSKGIYIISVNGKQQKLVVE